MLILSYNNAEISVTLFLSLLYSYTTIILLSANNFLSGCDHYIPEGFDRACDWSG